jgi:uncharacterized membrane protein YtjA (UPF0391 family)
VFDVVPIPVVMQLDSISVTAAKSVKIVFFIKVVDLKVSYFRDKGTDKNRKRQK